MGAGFGVIVLFEPSSKIVGAASVVSVVFAAKNIDVKWHIEEVFELEFSCVLFW